MEAPKENLQPYGQRMSRQINAHPVTLVPGRIWFLSHSWVTLCLTSPDAPGEPLSFEVLPILSRCAIIRFGLEAAPPGVTSYSIPRIRHP